MYDITTPSGNIIHHPEKGWRFSRETFEQELSIGKIKFSEDETRIIRKIYLKDQRGRVPETLWFAEEVGTTREANSEIKILDLPETFDTPKPERLIERVIQLATTDGDIVLDSFLGSGTTAAVAHKMGRRWIGVELGNHAYSVCRPRLIKVIDGEQGGISKAQNWQGGGGFKFYELAPSLLNIDKHGQFVINKAYNADMLAAAMAKQEGFTYQPSTEQYWKQGFSSEHDFIFTTTQFLTAEVLEQLHEQMAEDESLLICCTQFQSECNNRFSNITLKKIPKMLLGRCEFGRDDYSLNIVSLPEIDLEKDAYEDFPDVEEAQASDYEPNLFD